MTDEKHAAATEAACHIVNLLSGDHAGGKAQLFGAVLFAVLRAMSQMEGRLREELTRPSNN